MILMKIVCVSDYHRDMEIAKKVEKVAENERADVIVNAGDFLSQDFAKRVFDKTIFRTFVVRGNWDSELKTDNKNVTILVNQVVEYKGYHFLGVDFGQYSRIPELSKGIDPKKLIIITHDPPYEILDVSYFGTNAGFIDLRDVIFRVKPALHVFGHIHEAAGVMKHGGTLFVNAALPEFRKVAVVELPSQRVRIFDI